jgi:hypothetical protein
MAFAVMGEFLVPLWEEGCRNEWFVASPLVKMKFVDVAGENEEMVFRLEYEPLPSPEVCRFKYVLMTLLTRKPLR